MSNAALDEVSAARAGGSAPRTGHARKIGNAPLWASSALVLALLVPAAAGTTSREGPAKRTARPMLVVDVEQLPVEEQPTFAGLRGIVNRARPVPDLVGVRSAQDFEVDPSAEAWLADVAKVPHKRVNPNAALARLIRLTKGLVIWDPAIPYESQNVATTIAGKRDLLPVSPEMARRLRRRHGAKVKVDLRELKLANGREMTEWAIAKLKPPPGGWSFPVWTGRPRNRKPIQPGLRDWAVANRAFVFDADPASEPGLLRKVLDLLPRGSGVYGYLFFDTPQYLQTGLAIDEALGVGERTEAGDWLIPTTDAVNLSVHRHFDEPIRKPQWDDRARIPANDTTYVSFVVSDGDALGYAGTLMRSLQIDRLSDDSIPIGISIAPLLARVAPAVWSWYVDHLPPTAPVSLPTTMTVSLVIADTGRVSRVDSDSPSRPRERSAGARSSPAVRRPRT